MACAMCHWLYFNWLKLTDYWNWQQFDILWLLADHSELLASSSRDKSVRLWNWSQGQTVATLRLPGSAGGHARQRTEEFDKQRVWTALCWRCYDQLISTGLKWVTVLFWMLYPFLSSKFLVLRFCWWCRNLCSNFAFIVSAALGSSHLSDC